MPLSQCQSTQISSVFDKPPSKEKKVKNEKTFEKQFEIVKIKGDTEYYKDINRRFQAMFQFYIDGASFIDHDPNWQYFVCYMDHRVVGYTSVLEDNKTKKVLLSQFIILPPYQGLGLGSTLLRQVYAYYLNDKSCSEFSVEEPSDEF